MKLLAEKVRINRGGYDSRGQYFGTGAPLYRVTDAGNEGFDVYVRAANARAAKAAAWPDFVRYMQR